MKKWKKGMALLAIAAMIVQLLPVNVKAENLNTDLSEKQDIFLQD